MIEMSKKMKAALATIADARTGEISGWSVATWLGCKRDPSGIRESLRALVKRGLVSMRRAESGEFPNYLSAMYSINKEG